MGPETGRCRRTDGKLWRCRKDVVPGNKYCEGHMHRGRSRKRVEASGVTLHSNSHSATCSLSFTPTTTCSVKTSQKAKSHNLADTGAKFSTPIPQNQKNKNPSPGKSKGLTNTATTITTSSANGKSKPTSMFVKNDESSSKEYSDRLDGVDVSTDQIKDTNNEYSTNGDKHGGLVTPELSISLNNVAHGDTINSNSDLKNREITVEEPQRCKRTDGKRWRCSKEAIPQKKYCDSHISRGSKRSRLLSEAVTAAALVTLKFSPTDIDLGSSTSGSK